MEDVFERSLKGLGKVFEKWLVVDKHVEGLWKVFELSLKGL